MDLRDFLIFNEDIVFTNSYDIKYDIIRSASGYENYNPNGTTVSFWDGNPPNTISLFKESDLFKTGGNYGIDTTWATNLCIMRNPSYENNKLSNKYNNLCGNTYYQQGNIPNQNGLPQTFINCHYGNVWYGQYGSSYSNYKYPYEYFGLIGARNGNIRFCNDDECGFLPIYYATSIDNEYDYYKYGVICFARIDYIDYNHYFSNDQSPSYTNYRLLWMPLGRSLTSSYAQVVVDCIQRDELYNQHSGQLNIYQIKVKFKVLYIYDIFNPSQSYDPMYNSYYEFSQLFRYNDSNGSGNSGSASIGVRFTVGVNPNGYVEREDWVLCIKLSLFDGGRHIIY